jgi:hypothetical protein
MNGCDCLAGPVSQLDWHADWMPLTPRRFQPRRAQNQTRREENKDLNALNPEGEY